MVEVLDEVNHRNNQKIFSKVAFVIALTTIILASLLFCSFPTTVKPGQILEPNYFILFAVRLSVIIGLITTILSFYKGEPSTWYKWIAAVLNILFILFQLFMTLHNLELLLKQ